MSDLIRDVLDSDEWADSDDIFQPLQTVKQFHRINEKLDNSFQTLAGRFVSKKRSDDEDKHDMMSELKKVKQFYRINGKLDDLF